MGRFVKIPNETIRDKRLSYLARGLLAEALSHAESWRQDSLRATWQRGRTARGNRAEGLTVLRAAFAELEQHGYRHRHTWRERDGMHNQVFYSPTPASCGSERCQSSGCGVTESLSQPRPAETGVYAGGCGVTVPGTPQTVTASENHLTEDHQKTSAAPVENESFPGHWVAGQIDLNFVGPCPDCTGMRDNLDPWAPCDPEDHAALAAAVEAQRAGSRVAETQEAARTGVGVPLGSRTTYQRQRRVTPQEAAIWQAERDAGRSPYWISAKHDRPVTTIYAHTTKEAAGGHR